MCYAIFVILNKACESTEPALKSSISDDWTAVVDKASGGTYYWNKNTGKTTAVGASNPSKESVEATKASQTPSSSITAKTAITVVAVTILLKSFTQHKATYFS